MSRRSETNNLPLKARHRPDCKFPVWSALSACSHTPGSNTAPDGLPLNPMSSYNEVRSWGEEVMGALPFCVHSGTKSGPIFQGRKLELYLF